MKKGDSNDGDGVETLKSWHKMVGPPPPPPPAQPPPPFAPLYGPPAPPLPIMLAQPPPGPPLPPPTQFISPPIEGEMYGHHAGQGRGFVMGADEAKQRLKAYAAMKSGNLGLMLPAKKKNKELKKMS